MARNKRAEGFRGPEYLLCSVITLATFILCVCMGSVNIPLADTLSAVVSTLWGSDAGAGVNQSIIVAVRIPGVICVGLVGASLSLCGGAMQGLLRNPLADGSTLGVSAGASLGAVVAITFGVAMPIPWIAGSGTMLLAILFAFLSLLAILSLAYRLDYSLSTNTIILIGVIFTMFANSIISLLQTYAGDKVKTIVFWMMGSLSGCSYSNAATLLVALILCGSVILRYCRELNAFAIGEDNARHVGIDVRRVKLAVMVAVSALIGVSVSIGGSIGFVGLVIPHITRMLTGPNHKRLLPACMYLGAVFLMLADLISRTLLKPQELPIGVVTSIIGSVVFVYIFYSIRKGR